MNNLAIVKLGGSVITHKESSPPTVNKDNLYRIARELGSHDGELIVVLGGGAHGHQAAHKHGFGKSSTTREILLEGVSPIRHSMTVLSLEIEQVLNGEGVQAVVLPPFTMATLQNRKIADFPTEMIQRSLDSGLVALTHGDVCFDNILGASILSGDTIAVYLAKEMKAKALYIGTDVDGVLEDDPRINPNTKHIEVLDTSTWDAIVAKTGPSSATDVTGGMKKKLDEISILAGLGIDIAIFNLGVSNRLSSLLSGTSTLCTRIQI
ncbi:MAG: isopentenyl phosphate kinase family protein [Candidatus Thorarchaeota archaeon]|nr:MAG: isopentenyl phosphate kinase family protein [Candidatus Thorarchaeota archaeon]